MSCCVHQAALSKLESLKIDADYNWVEEGAFSVCWPIQSSQMLPFRTYPGCTDWHLWHDNSVPCGRYGRRCCKLCFQGFFSGIGLLCRSYLHKDHSASFGGQSLLQALVRWPLSILHLEHRILDFSGMVKMTKGTRWKKRMEVLTSRERRGRNMMPLSILRERRAVLRAFSVMVFEEHKQTGYSVLDWAVKSPPENNSKNKHDFHVH